MRRLVEVTTRAFGRIDVLVCNAASNPYYGPMAGISDEQFRKIFDNNVLANNWLIQMAAPGMIERSDGSIVLISSIGGLKGSPVIGAYDDLQGRRFPARAQSRGRVGQAQRAGQLHRPGPGQDRFRPGAVGESGRP